MIRTTQQLMRPPFIANHKSIMRDTGRQVAFELLTEKYKYGAWAIQLAAVSAVGDTELNVDPLTKALKAGDLIDFGLTAGFNVTLSGNEAIGQTDLAVVALPGYVPVGTILRFGAGEHARVTTEGLPGATSLIVEALEVAIESGDAAPVAAVRNLVRVTAAAAIGAVTVTVEGVPGYLADNSIGYSGGKNGHGYVLAGTEMDLLSDGRILPSEIGTADVTCYCILETSADELQKSDALSGYGCITQGMLYENLLPGASGSPKVINSTFKTELLARGGAWMFLQYADNT